MADKIIYGLRIRKDKLDADLFVDKSAAIYVKEDHAWTNTVLLPTDKPIFWGSIVDSNNAGVYVNTSGQLIVVTGGGSEVFGPIEGGTGVTTETDSLINANSYALFEQTADGTVANTSTETTVSAAGNGSLTLPVDFFSSGRTLRLSARGLYGTDGVSAGNLTIKVKLGSTVILTTGTITLTTGLTNKYWELEGLITCRTDGVTGTVFGHGGFNYFETAIKLAPMTNTTTQTINTTLTQVFDVTATFSVADSDNTITCQILTLDTLY